MTYNCQPVVIVGDSESIQPGGPPLNIGQENQRSTVAHGSRVGSTSWLAEWSVASQCKHGCGAQLQGCKWSQTMSLSSKCHIIRSCSLCVYTYQIDCNFEKKLNRSNLYNVDLRQTERWCSACFVKETDLVKSMRDTLYKGLPILGKPLPFTDTYGVRCAVRFTMQICHRILNTTTKGLNLCAWTGQHCYTQWLCKRDKAQVYKAVDEGR